MVSFKSFIKVLLVIAFFSNFAFAEKKEIVVEPVGLKVLVEPEKEAFYVNEPITFYVKPNKDCYFYVFYYYENEKTAKMIFPNKLDKKNKLKANKEIQIPKKSQFVGDKPAVEKFTLVVSTSRLKDDDLIIFKNEDEKGFSFVQGKEAEDFMKDIIVSASSLKKRELAILELNVKIIK